MEDETVQDETLPPSAIEPHPLDEFEFGKPELSDNSRIQAHKPLLRWSVIVAAVAFGVIFVSSVLGNNAPFNSLLQRGCSTISGLGAMVMLAACTGILFAYRLPLIDIDRLKHGAVGAKGWLANGLVTLALLNLLLLLMLWAGVFLLGGVIGWLYASGIFLFAICFVGVAATMTVTHTGYLRGYAIGVLTVLLPLCLGVLSMSIFYAPYLGGGRFMGGPVPMVAGTVMMLAIMLTVACGVGLVCASYAAAVDWVRTRRTPATEFPVITAGLSQQKISG